VSGSEERSREVGSSEGNIQRIKKYPKILAGQQRDSLRVSQESQHPTWGLGGFWVMTVEGTLEKLLGRSVSRRWGVEEGCSELVSQR
jgi:hypothetical protein